MKNRFLLNGLGWVCLCLVGFSSAWGQPAVTPTTPAAPAPSQAAPAPSQAAPAPSQAGPAEPGLPVGTLRFEVVDEAQKPLRDVPVQLYRRANDKSPVEQLPVRNTDEQGVLVFAGLAHGDAEYLAVFSHFGYQSPSEPFHLPSTQGHVMRVVVRRPAQGPEAKKSLSFGQGSHVLLEVQEDLLAVTETLQLHNALPTAVDPGKDGLRIELPPDAISPQLPQGNPTTLSLDQSSPGRVALVWKGLVPPLATMLSVSFLLRHTGSLDVAQLLGLPAPDLRVVMEKRKAVEFSGLSDVKERDFSGKTVLFGVPDGAASGEISFSVTGLPKEHRATRLVGGIVALLIAAAFLVLSYREHKLPKPTRAALSDRRDRFLRELLAVREGAKTAGRSEQAVLLDLAKVYRQLDELDDA
ncbi:MAG TPA: hypothetical protein PKE31_11185 [Pseudomonadota bacterium]|nr:hypothetical protein [Pseudomonadota bacterium]